MRTFASLPCSRFALVAFALPVLSGCNDDAVLRWLSGGDPRPPAHEDLPEVRDYGGPVLADPRVVPIFFQEDSNRPDLERFLAALPGSDYWHATTSEYGVGDLRTAPSVVLPEAAPDTVSDREIAGLLSFRIDSDGFPPRTLDDIYLVFYPSHTTVSIPSGDSCIAFDGFHSEGGFDGDPADPTGLPIAQTFVFGVVATCDRPGTVLLDSLTRITSHELVEASTDPHTISAPAYATLSTDQYAWGLSTDPSQASITAGELADLCFNQESSWSLTTRLPGGFAVQRSWSNLAAEAGAEPCVPGAFPFFSAAPDLMESVPFSVSEAETFQMRGLHLALGESKTVDVRVFGDDSVSAVELAADTHDLDGAGVPPLAFFWDQSHAGIGDVRRLSIRRIGTSSGAGSLASVFAIEAQPQGPPITHRWPIWVTN